MAQPPALDVGDVLRLNLRAIRDWMDKHKSKIKARPNRTVLYAGRDFDLEVIPGLDPADRKTFMGTPMWKRIEQTRKALHDLKLPCEFETLEDVLKSIRDVPRIVDRDRQPLRFSNAFEFFSELATLTKLVPDAKGTAREAWEQLSRTFAGNAQGDIRILDGAADDYGKLREDKILLRKELEALLKNDQLSPKAKALLQKKVSAYGDHFDRRYTALMARLNEDKARLKRK